MADYKKPIPAVTPEMKPFFDAAKRHELVVQRCTRCGLHRFPARDICSNCLSREGEWVKASGHGEVFSLDCAAGYGRGLRRVSAAVGGGIGNRNADAGAVGEVGSQAG